MDIVNKLTKDYLNSNNKNYEHEKNEFSLDYVRQKFFEDLSKEQKKDFKEIELNFEKYKISLIKSVIEFMLNKN